MSKKGLSFGANTDQNQLVGLIRQYSSSLRITDWWSRTTGTACSDNTADGHAPEEEFDHDPVANAEALITGGVCRHCGHRIYRGKP